MPIVSSTFGLGKEQVVLSPAEAKGITVAYPYVQEVPNPTNEEFLASWLERTATSP
ncbi:MAG: hypothetical protein M3Q22_14890 [Actinomycetota bacterium]|nr:hypothetical protein [Actinomycetota bacterium]